MLEMRLAPASTELSSNLRTVAPDTADPTAPGVIGPICIGIASAVRLVREGLSATLRGRAGIAEVVAFSPDAGGLLLLKRAAPDVVLVDLSASDPEPAAQAVRTACPDAKLVAFALTEQDHTVLACAASGFAGYVSKEGGADQLHCAILDASRGRLQCPPHIAAVLFNQLGRLLRKTRAAQPIAQLTVRENEVLMLADQGRSNKEIARLLRISNATVKNHMHSILQKLQVDRRGQATAQLRRGAPLAHAAAP